MDRIVLAYSGSLEASAAILWLREHYEAEIATVTVDLGQHESLDGIRVRALAAGAVRAHVLDRRDVFARHHLLPAVQTGAEDIDSEDAMSALGRPLIAHALVEIAQIEGARQVAHAALDAADAAAIGAAITAIEPSMQVIDVAREWALTAATVEDYARAHGIPVATPAAPTRDEAPIPPRPASSDGVRVTMEFRAGVPVKINGVEMELVELLTSLDTIAASQAVAGSVVLGVAYRALQERVGAAAVTGAEEISVRNGACEVVTNV